jgi:hypothetical protein
MGLKSTSRNRWRGAVPRIAAVAAAALALVGATASTGYAAGTGAGRGTATGPAPVHHAVAHPAVAKPVSDELVPSQPGKFVQSAPVRLLDTRAAVGVPTRTPVAQGGVVRLALGLPADAKAVVLNLTATDTRSAGYLTVYPDGQAKPATSNLDFASGETRANLVTVAVTDGSVDICNQSAGADVIADLEGYYTDDTATTGSSYYPLSPSRLLDTRASHTPVGPHSSIALTVTGQAGVPATGVTSVVLNVTETDATTPGFFTVYADGQPVPPVSHLNFGRDETVPNLVVVPVPADGKVDIGNAAGTADAIVDVEGYYSTSPLGSGFSAVTPSRIEDTRTAHSRVAGGTSVAVQVEGAGGVPSSGVTAALVNVTSADATQAGYFTVYPDGADRPTASNLNFAPRQAVANLVAVPVGADGKIDVYNGSGSADVIVDVFGYFAAPQGAPTNLKIMQGYDGGYIWPSGTTAPGPWVIPADGGDGPGLELMAQIGTSNAGATLEVVVTGPNGTHAYDGTSSYGDNEMGVPILNWASGSYSWYAVSSYQGQVSPVSATSYFQVDADTVITSVTGTVNPPTGLHTGMTVQITLAATSTGTTAGKDISGFCYSFGQPPAVGCTPTPAVDGKLTFDFALTGWGSYTLYIDAMTVSGHAGGGELSFLVSTQ